VGIETIKKKKNLPHISDGFQNKVIESYKKELEKIISVIFQKLPLSEIDKENLYWIGGNLFTKQFVSTNHTGIVFAGYGEKEIFPSLSNLVVDGLINEQLIYEIRQESSIDINKSAAIIPLAQDEGAVEFISGINPQFEETTRGYLTTLFEKYPQVIVESLKPLEENYRKNLLGLLNKHSKKQLEDFYKKLDECKQLDYINPFLTIVDIMSKDELAYLAEVLVSLTSLKRKMSLNEDTVGGPIDVAVISKADGFIWIKRKYYFKPEYNPTFFMNYFNERREN
jgi:hypothetical protein